MEKKNKEGHSFVIGVRTDCFAYKKGESPSSGGDCKALKALYCQKEKCNFFKPKVAAEEE